MKYLLLLSSMTLAIVGQMFLKKGVLLSSLSQNIQSIIKTLFSPFIILGFIAYGISSIIWLFVLQKFPLSIAYPAVSLTYIAIVIFSFYFLKEPLTLNKIVGIAFIVIGVYIMFR